MFECLFKKFKIPIVKMSTENIFLLPLNPPSNNVELQKIIAKHMHDCYEIRNPQGCKIHIVNLFGLVSMYNV